MNPWSIALLAGAVLGLTGAVHCLGMCGPLVIAMGKSKSSSSALIVYHAARTGSYLLLGTLVMFLVPMAEWQRVLSVVSGLFLLFAAWQEQYVEPACCTTQKTPWHRRLLQWRIWSMKNTSGAVNASVLGGLNGLLPCGMVYAALASASAFGGWMPGLAFLLGFGVTTAIPLIILQWAGRHIPAQWATRWKRASIIIALLMGSWFILRGLGLGIPFLSPTEQSLQLESHVNSAPASDSLDGNKTEKPGACCTK